ncbi:MAG: hypothetical protein ACTHOE_10960, partial [Conexibacter sp.]
MREHAYAAFGLRLTSPTPLRLRPDDGAARRALALRPLSSAALSTRWSGRARRLWATERDGTPVSVERGRGGEHRIEAAGVATFVLSADRAELACATPGDAARDWQRALEELALPCASLLLGNEALHAGAVALEQGAVALLAPSGGGKSTLASALLEAGGTLLSDDVLALRRDGERIVAEAGAPTLKLAAAPRAEDGPHVLAGPLPETRMALTAEPLAARPLTLLVVLARGALAGEAPRLEPLGLSPMPVLAHALSLPSSPERAGARL